MTDQDAKIRLQILVSNYVKLATKRSHQDKADAERVIDSIAGNEEEQSIFDWLFERGNQNKLSIRHALKQLDPVQEYFQEDSDFASLIKAIESALVDPEDISHAEIMISLNLLHEVGYLSGNEITGSNNIEFSIRRLFPRFRLSRSEKTRGMTLERIQKNIGKFRNEHLRTSSRKSLTRERVRDYDTAISLITDIRDREQDANMLERLDLAIEKARAEQIIAERSLAAWKKGRLK